MPAASLLTLDALEVHSGIVLGPRRDGPPPVEAPLAGTPAEVLEQLLLPALAEGRCRVLFSGGRDSSVVLAAAVRAARRHGLPDPIALTARFPGHPRTWEDEWQQETIDHLGLHGWERFDVRDELDALGPLATDALLRHGVFWPSNAHAMLLFAQQAGGGSIVTGGGGDELLEPWYWRRAAWSALRGLRPRRRALKWTAYYALPTRLRQRVIEARRPLRLAWLRPAALREIEARHALQPPSPTWATGLRAFVAGRHAQGIRGAAQAFGRDGGATVVEPFRDPRLVESVIAVSPRDGYASRSAALGALFADLLPPAVLARESKAVFTESAWGAGTRAFAEAWDGSGVDPTLVDPELLRREWRRAVPDARSITALHQAWLTRPDPARRHPGG